MLRGAHTVIGSVAALAATDAGASPLSELAESLQPGTWGELSAAELDATMSAAGASGIKIPYSDDLVWDPTSDRAFFIGGDHADLADHLMYDGASNTWSTLPRPAWVPAGTSHGYDHSALDPSRGLLYHRPFYDNTVYRYDIANQSWSDIPSPPDNGTSCCDALEYFPPLDALVWAHHSYGEVWAFGEATSDWTLLGSLPPGDTWQVAAYNPVGESMIFVYDETMYRLTADGTIEPAGSLGAPVYDGSGYNGVFTVDPVSGVYIVSTPAGEVDRVFWAFDDAADTWGQLPEQPTIDLTHTAMVAAPIAEYGVTLFTYCYGNTPCGMLVYKHSPFRAPPDEGGSDGADGTTDEGGVDGGSSGAPPDPAEDASASDDSLPGGGSVDGSANEGTGNAGGTGTVVEQDSDGDAKGCSCRAGGGSTPPIVILAGLFALVGGFRRGRRRHPGGRLCVAALTAAAACADPPPAAEASGTTESSTESSAEGRTTASATASTMTATGDASSAAPPDEPSPGTDGGADSSSGDDPVDSSDFETRCAQSGVLVCVGFDDPADLDGTWGDNHGTLQGAAVPELDPSTKASGESALRFTVPSNSGSDSSGSYFTNFSADLETQFDGGSDFFVQWRQRFSSEMITTDYDGGGGWKQAIIGVGDLPGCSASNAINIGNGGSCSSSCTELETVVQNTGQRGFSQMYNSCSGSASHGAYDPFEEPFRSFDFKLQNARPDPYCLYSQTESGYFAPQGNCLGYAPDEWMTFQVQVTVGSRVGDEFVASQVRLWIAREGQPSELVLDWGPYNLTAGDPTQNLRFGKVWLLPYHTGKSAAQAHPTAYTWYDELIVSTERIDDPQ